MTRQSDVLQKKNVRLERGVTLNRHWKGAADRLQPISLVFAYFLRSHKRRFNSYWISTFQNFLTVSWNSAIRRGMIWRDCYDEHEFQWGIQNRGRRSCLWTLIATQRHKTLSVNSNRWRRWLTTENSATLALCLLLWNIRRVLCPADTHSTWSTFVLALHFCWLWEKFEGIRCLVFTVVRAQTQDDATCKKLHGGQRLHVPWEDERYEDGKAHATFW